MPTTETDTRYRIEADDSLGGIAERFGLAGPYALYFAPGNQPLREIHPDPTRIPPGIELHLPLDAEEQRAGLLAHLRRMEQTRDAVLRIRAGQLAAFREIGAGSGPPRERLTGLLAAIVERLLEGIRALKFADSGMSRANLALAFSALEQRPIVTPAIAIDALNQCHLATGGVYWLIENHAALAWCDPSSPAFWGRAAATAIASPDLDRLDVGLVCNGLSGPYQVASERVAQGIELVIRDLIGELNALDGSGRESCALE